MTIVLTLITVHKGPSPNSPSYSFSTTPRPCFVPEVPVCLSSLFRDKEKNGREPILKIFKCKRATSFNNNRRKCKRSVCSFSKKVLGRREGVVTTFLLVIMNSLTYRPYHTNTHSREPFVSHITLKESFFPSLSLFVQFP